MASLGGTFILGVLWHDSESGESYSLDLHCTYDSESETLTLDDVTSPDGQHAVNDCPDSEIEAWRQDLETALNRLVESLCARCIVERTKEAEKEVEAVGLDWPALE